MSFVQRELASETETILKQQLGTRVQIERIDLGFLNRFIIDGLTIYDQTDNKMLSTTRVSARIDLLTLIEGLFRGETNIQIASAQIFGLDADIYRKSADSPLNCQFLIDALSSEDNEESKPMKLRIASLVIRNGAFKYNDLFVPERHNIFDASHLAISNISSHIIIYNLTNESTDIYLKNLSLKEKSGINVNNLTFTLKSKSSSDDSPSYLNLTELNLALNKTHVSVPALYLMYKEKDKQIVEGSLSIDGQLNINHLSSEDLVPFTSLPLDAFPYFDVDASIKGTDTKSSGSIVANASDQSFSFVTNYTLNNLLSSLKWNISSLNIDVTPRLLQTISESFSLPSSLAEIGNVKVTSSLSGVGSSLNGNLSVTTQYAGSIVTKGTFANDKGAMELATSELDLKALTGVKELGVMTSTIDSRFRIVNSELLSMNAEVNLDKIDVLNYEYHGISLSADMHKSGVNDAIEVNLNSKDPNFLANIELQTVLNNWKPFKVDGNIEVEHFVPSLLGISKDWGNSSFAFNAETSFTGNSLNNIDGYLNVSDFVLNGGHVSLGEEAYNGNPFVLRNLEINTTKERDNQRSTSIKSDFCNIVLNGKYSFDNITTNFTNVISRYIPSFPGIGTYKPTSDEFNFNASISSLEFLRLMTGIDMAMNGVARISGYYNDDISDHNIYISIPSLKYDEYTLGDFSFLTWIPDQTLHATLSGNIGSANGHLYSVNIGANAVDDNLFTDIKWSDESLYFRGNIRVSASSCMDIIGNQGMKFLISPSEINLGDSVWTLHSDDILYFKDKVSINDFSLGNENQHVYINGTASPLATDSLVVDLKDVNVEYIMDLVNFHSVDFAGYASGKATGSMLMSNSPITKASLCVSDFTFENGNMGNLDLIASYNNVAEQIELDGVAKDSISHLGIKGFISPHRNEMILNLDLNHTRLDFLKSYTKSFIDHIDLYADGDLILGGPLSGLDLKGKVVADGRIHVSTLGCAYTLPNDTVILDEKGIMFQNGKIVDRYGHSAIVNGGLYHNHFSNITYDFNFKTNNFLAYDFDDFGDDVFYGTAFVTGDCRIQGRSSSLNVTVNGSTEDESIIVYDASSPDGVSRQDYITWGSLNDANGLSGYSYGKENASLKVMTDDDNDMRTDVNLDFHINIDEKSTLRVLMNRETGDFIDLHGSGALHATYFNKGTFQLFGRYGVQNGHYLMSIQNFIKRDFEFQSGNIDFQGEPYSATLNLLAKYSLTSVPLSELNIGASFNKNNVPVDCILYIKGTPLAPEVDFDLDLPTVNTDIKQMIYSLMDTEDVRRQQVIYLLSVGQFLSQGVNNATDDNEQYSSTNQAMRSIISGTISQQLDAALGSVLNSSKWSVGANIAPGNEGFTNAEYEGKFSGKLLSNRLMINGVVGYRDNATTSTQGFIGNYDISYLLVPNGNIAVKVYNQANDRYFIKNSLNTQGIGILLKTDFNNWLELFRRRKKAEKKQ